MTNQFNVAKMIEELRKMGFSVEAHKRTDGGWIIKKINDMSFTGASGNAYARQILGVELSQARIEQTSFNVQKYIKGSKKPKDQIDEKLNKELKKVQRRWRKKNVQAKITKKKLRWHIKEGGREEAEAYLKKMSRYGEGYAYEENVEYLAKYIEDIAKGIITNDKLQDDLYALAEYIRSKKDTFKEEWIAKCYEYAYFIIENHYDENMARFCMQKIYETIG